MFSDIRLRVWGAIMFGRMCFGRCALLSAALATFWSVMQLGTVQADKPNAEQALEQTMTLDLGGGVKMELILIRPGTFTMGTETANGVEKAHKVTITNPFYLGKYEVTQEQWEAVMGNYSSVFKGAKNPIEHVSWEDVHVFLAKLQSKFGTGSTNFMLPTEAQWEYACRAGSTKKFCFGDEESGLGEYGWLRGNAELKTHPVGQRKPNAWGLHDMHGNAWEWCADWYDDQYYSASPPSDPTGPHSGDLRVMRGGCWNSLPDHCRSAVRGGNPSSNRGISTGLRVACER